MELDVVVTTAPTATDRPPLILVHGAWHSSWCWTENWAGLLADRGYTSYAVDLRGHGRSPGRLRRSRIGHYVHDVRRVAMELDREPVLIGHSMGGFVVQHYLMDHRAAGGVLLAPVPTRGAIGATLRVARRHPKAFIRANATLNLGPIVDESHRAKALLFSPRTDPVLANRYAEMVQDESYLAYLEMILDLPRPSKVSDPILVLGAEDDGIFTPSEIRATARAYGTEALIFEHMGHNMMLDTGWERPAAAVADWLDELRVAGDE